MIKKLIVNADDYGLTEGVTLGILHSHADGIVTSTTCMMNMPFAKFGLELAKDYPKFGIGIHFVLTAGRPLVDGAKSFTDEDGNFIHVSKYEEGIKTDKEELYREWKAQMELYIEYAGHKPTHIDSHHHVHLMKEHVEVAIQLAKEYDLPMRQRDNVYNGYTYVRCADRMYGDLITPEFMQSELDTDEEYLEYMCHPSYLDQRLYEMTSYGIPRMKEMVLLRSDVMKKFIKDNNIELINYSDLKKQG